MWMAAVARLVDQPVATVAWTIGAEGAVAPDKRRFTGQVRDRRGRPWANATGWVVLVWIANASTLAVSAPASIAANAGAVLSTPTPGVCMCLTTPAGVIELDVEVAGAATRKIVAIVLQPALATESVAWT